MSWSDGFRKVRNGHIEAPIRDIETSFRCGFQDGKDTAYEIGRDGVKGSDIGSVGQIWGIERMLIHGGVNDSGRPNGGGNVCVVAGSRFPALIDANGIAQANDLDFVEIPLVELFNGVNNLSMTCQSDALGASVQDLGIHQKDLGGQSFVEFFSSETAVRILPNEICFFRNEII